jgi:hypothetical protein
MELLRGTCLPPACFPRKSKRKMVLEPGLAATERSVKDGSFPD